jgi:hypothetical protein
MRANIAVVSLLVLQAAWVARVRAQSTASLAGTWQAGATSMDVAVESWGNDCGPRPQASQSAGGGNVAIEAQGQALVIHGRDRDIRTDQCWSPNPMLRRVGSSYVAGLWVTRCKTRDQDPREEQGTYTLKLLASDRLLYQDVSHFNWRLNTSTCTATITTTQTLHRGAARAAQPAAAPTPTPTPTVTASAAPPPPVPLEDSKTPCVPKNAARISLRPHDAEIALGERVCFHARVLDAAGCALPDANITWSLDHAPGIKAKLQDGCLQAGASSAESEGTFRVTAAHAAMRAEANVQVRAESLTSLIAKRLQAGAIEGELNPPAPTTPEPALPAKPAVRVAARAVAEAAPNNERWFAALAAALAACAGVLLLLRRSTTRKRASTPNIAPASRGSAAPKSRTRVCPNCGSEYPESSAFCGKDGAALRPPK